MGTTTNPAVLQQQFDQDNGQLSQDTTNYNTMYGQLRTDTAAMAAATNPEQQLWLAVKVLSDIISLTGDKVKISSDQNNVMSDLSTQAAAIQQQNAICLNDVQNNNNNNLSTDTGTMVSLLQNFQGDLGDCQPWMTAPGSPYAGTYNDLNTTIQNLISQLSNGYTTSATAQFPQGTVINGQDVSGQNILSYWMPIEYSYYQSNTAPGSTSPSFTPTTQETNTLQLIGTLVNTTSALSKQGTIYMNFEVNQYTTGIQQAEYDEKRMITLLDYEAAKQTAN